MNLAVIFFFGVLFSPWGGPEAAAAHKFRQVQAIVTAQTGSSNPGKQDASVQNSTPTQTPAPAKPKKKHRPKAASVNCENKTAPSANSTADSPSTTTSAAGANTTASNCPPKKTVVRQGGTSEPSIQLAGGASSQTAQPKDSAGQLLGTTEENLKKIAGHPLTSDQQDMVNQVHQFMEQTKTAVAAGDMERARTLAWKAQVLSEELAKPQ